MPHQLLICQRTNSQCLCSFIKPREINFVFTSKQYTSNMERVLVNLIASVEAAVAALQGPLSEELQMALHDADKLPDKKLSALAAEAESLLDRAQLLIQPSVELLADNFLGMRSLKFMLE